MKVKVIRAILHQGKPQKISTILDLEKNLANELVYLGKCEFVSNKMVESEPEPEPEKKSKK
jgi:hypothetical protein